LTLQKASTLKKRVALTLYPLFFSLAAVNRVIAADESFADQFLGSPLLILVGVIVIVGLAFIYHRIRK
jgi:hypothetical protein